MAATQRSPDTKPADIRIYDGDSEELLSTDLFPDRVSLLPGRTGPSAADRIRILWGHDMLRDVLDGRYRAVICGVNDHDNSRGIIVQLVNLIQTSQWDAASVTSYAKVFQESAALHASGDREPFVLKFDLDRVLILALLRPRGRDHFDLDDLRRGFTTIASMLEGRKDRFPVATVSFLNARANRLQGPDGREPSFETVLRTMHETGFRGDAYPAPAMWSRGGIGVFPSYPFPEGLERMRDGSS
jgi:hypothetical protein